MKKEEMSCSFTSISPWSDDMEQFQVGHSSQRKFLRQAGGFEEWNNLDFFRKGTPLSCQLNQQ